MIIFIALDDSIEVIFTHFAYQFFTVATRIAHWNK